MVRTTIGPLLFEFTYMMSREYHLHHAEDRQFHKHQLQVTVIYQLPYNLCVFESYSSFYVTVDVNGISYKLGSFYLTPDDNEEG